MEIKTLAEILAESEADSASTPVSKQKTTTQKYLSKKSAKRSQPVVKSKYPKSSPARSTSEDDETSQTFDHFDNDTSSFFTPEHSSKSSKTKPKKRKKRFHPAANFEPEPNNVPTYQSPEPQSIKDMLAEVKRDIHDNSLDDKSNIKENSDTDNVIDDTTFGSTDEHLSEPEKDTAAVNQMDNLPSALKAYLRTPEQRQADVDAIKAESRLRWLAFYYLSRREHGKAELKQKLLDKEQNPAKIDALLEEFEQKGYQSDYRTTLMLIRENIRKGRGRGRIKQEFYRKKMVMPGNIDELIDMANAESDEFSEFVDDSADNLVEGIDWLKLAVAARTKKYGDDIPTEQKDKARQLRFLQYRGFKSDICFAALNYTLDTLDERF
ncbi:regulatory protein RecX [Psychrobacter sp. W2-37-MNA-CIBAN-0211]|uniref:regulatory protein RecX n=1 Tax=Psychrobacter sp. W2-37-MNA-CIBAN-0211 TaxID=3140443 RepID=UPI0033331D8F